MKRVMIMMSAMVVSSIAVAENTWWVDATHTTGGPYNGQSDATGFGTIQEAVEAADSGDTIKVLPGTYDQGGKSDGRMFNRVAIMSKKIRLESTGGRDVTFIVGRHSSGSVHDSNAIRCIYADTSNTEIVGFTICDGDTQANSTNSDGFGGGLYAGTSYVRAIDCTFRNCWGSRGGAMCQGTAIRCLFVGNRKYDGANGAIARSSYLFNCIAVNNILDGQPALHGCYAVNCTFIGNGSNGGLLSSDDGCVMRNCIAVANAGKNAASGAYDYRGSVIAGDSAEIVMASGYEQNIIGAAFNVPNTQVRAPVLGDFRPMAGTAAATNGLADIMLDDIKDGKPFVDHIPEADRYLDFETNAIPRSGSICAGAIQSVAPAPVCGAIGFAAGQKQIFGTLTVVDDLYFHPDTYPTQLRLTPDSFYGANGRDVYLYWVGSNSSANYRNPSMDESFYVVPPVTPMTIFRVGVIWAENTYRVAKNGNDGNDGITAPFATLQRAADMAVDYSLVMVGEGLYGDDQGSTVWDGHNTRLQVGSDKHIRFKGAGREKTILEGKADTSVAYNGGQGPAAIRCVSTGSALVSLQGFTFRNGFAGWTGSNEAKSYSGGGALYLKSSNPVSDCMFTNCAGYRGTCYGGSYSRCDFYQCKGSNGGMRSVGYYASCKFVQCPGSYAGSFCYNDSTAAFLNCSIYGQTTSDTYGGSIPCWNTAVNYGKEIKANTTYYGCLFYNIGTLPSSTTGWINVWPQYVAQPMDLRPMAGSPCETSGEVPTADNYGATYHLYATTDLNGLPIHFNESGAPMVGCHQRPVTTVDVSVPAYGTFTPSGTFAIDDGESVTFTYEKDSAASRGIEGFVINGTFVPTNGVDYSCVYTAPGADEFPTRFGISAVLSTNWYVDVKKPNDDGDGFTPATAKRTLAGIMSCAVRSGDVVHVAPGEYAEGCMTGHLGPNAQTTNRVEIASGVTLVGDAGADATVIRGKLSDAPFSTGYPAYGRGPGAMRAVWMGANAKLKGFTIVDGMTAALTTPATSEPDDLDTTGGGIYASDSSCIIEGCVITNCTANRSGGVQSGTLVNCALYQNASIGAGQGDAGSYNRFYGCYIGKQRSSNGAKGTGKLENCTVEGPVISGSSLVVKNCLFLGSTTVVKSISGVVWSVFEDRASITNNCAGVVFENCKFRPASALQLDERHVPVYSACEAIDAGNADYLASVLSSTGVDAAGGQRIYNGTLDVGAFECDFRPVYAAALGGKVTVEHADSAVTLESGKVRLTDGTLLSGRWKPLSTTDMTSYRVVAEAAGAGTLEGHFSDRNSFEKVFETSSSLDDWRFKAALAELDFAIGFNGDGYGFVSQFRQKLPGFRIDFH